MVAILITSCHIAFHTTSMYTKYFLNPKFGYEIKISNFFDADSCKRLYWSSMNGEPVQYQDFPTRIATNIQFEINL